MTYKKLNHSPYYKSCELRWVCCRLNPENAGFWSGSGGYRLCYYRSRLSTAQWVNLMRRNMHEYIQFGGTEKSFFLLAKSNAEPLTGALKMGNLQGFSTIYGILRRHSK